MRVRYANALVLLVYELNRCAAAWREENANQRAEIIDACRSITSRDDDFSNLYDALPTQEISDLCPHQVGTDYAKWATFSYDHVDGLIPTGRLLDVVCVVSIVDRAYRMST